jgi:hypothetical protein
MNGWRELISRATPRIVTKIVVEPHPARGRDRVQPLPVPPSRAAPSRGQLSSPVG